MPHDTASLAARHLTAEGKPWWSYWPRNLGFIVMHAAVLLVFVAGVSPVAVAAAVFSHYARAFGLTAGYHRYFAHRAFKTSRVMQFLLAYLGACAAQRGPLWWAGHHVQHHRAADTPEDIHSPVRRGFWWSHVGWTFAPEYAPTPEKALPDYAKYPELRWLNKYDKVAPLTWAVACYLVGAALQAMAPSLGTSGFQMVIWGFVVPTVTLYHATFCVNSACHLWGRRRYETNDRSRNNPLVAFFTMGEGWHNNHHKFPPAARQGVAWWEVDLTYIILRGMERLGLVHGMKSRPAGK